MAVLGAAPAVAQDEEEAPADVDEESLEFVRAADRTPRAGTPLIANKLYPMQFRFEGSALFDMSYGNKYVEHYGGHLSLNFHIFDWLAIEGFGAYMYSEETNIADKVRQAGKSASQLSDDPSLCATPTCEPELPDLYKTTWFAGAHGQWSPIYGKLSFVSELDLSFQLYGMLGGGVEGVTKRLNDGTYLNSPDGSGFIGTGIRPVLSYGAGIRLIPWKWFAIRAEFRNTHGLNPEVPERNNQGIDQCDTGYTLQVGQRTDCITDFSTLSTIQLGVSFLL
jgi:outer membrane beta-barrel protein